MKKVFYLAATFMMVMPTFAQDETTTETKTEKKPSKFGNFIRRVGESTTGINMSNETFVAWSMEAQQAVKAEVISCIGNSQTGEVLLTLAATAKGNSTTLDLGDTAHGSGNEDYVCGYDTKGGTYWGREVGSFTQTRAKDLTAGVPIQYQFLFTGVPASLATLEVVKSEFSIYVKSSNTHITSGRSNVEPMQVRNIPILWDPAVTE